MNEDRADRGRRQRHCGGDTVSEAILYRSLDSKFWGELTQGSRLRTPIRRDQAGGMRVNFGSSLLRHPYMAANTLAV